MKYTVVWKPEAERRLADIWADAADRVSITVAANEIDRSLSMNPEDAGESRDGRRRLLVSPPLAVVFTADPQDRLAQVLAVWTID